MLNKFSVGHNLNSDKAKSGHSNAEKKQPKEKIKTLIKPGINALDEDVVRDLLALNFNLEQVLTAFSIYKFSSVEDAVNIMIKDPETGRYLHKYIEGHSYKCKICGDEKTYHLLTSTKNTGENEGIIDNDVVDSNRNRNKNYIIEFDKLMIEIPSEFEDPDVCRICYNETVNGSAGYRLSCNHVFCRECCRKYSENKIMNGIVTKIPCLQAGCNKMIKEEDIKILVSSDMWLRYRKFSQQKIYMESDKVYQACPFPNCEELTLFEKDKKLYECQSKHKFCSICKKIGWHLDNTCIEYENSITNIIKKNYPHLNFQQCPKCKVLIEKIDGCNHMTCVSCSYEFCWLCLNKYENNHYSIYNFSGCPGLEFSTAESEEKKSKCQKCLWYFFCFIVGFFLVILIIIFFFFFGCSYEFIKCYLDKGDKDKGDGHDIEGNRGANRNKNEGLTGGQIAMCVFLGILGFFCQPIYLMFYILYAFMLCYKNCGCIFFYASTH